MAENLIKRVRRIVSGSVRDLIASLEQANAGTVMREAIREVEDAIGDVQEEIGHVAARAARLARHVEWLRGKHDELKRKIDLALSEDREDLAEAAIARQLELESQIAAEEEALRELAAREKEYIELRTSLVERRRELEKQYRDWLHVARAGKADADCGGPSATVGEEVERRVQEAEQAFTRILTGDEFATDAEVLRETAAKMHELDQMERKKEIARRLAEVKARRASA